MSDIPDEAVDKALDAACVTFCESYGFVVEETSHTDQQRAEMRAALEAALPHLHAQWLHSLPLSRERERMREELDDKDTRIRKLEEERQNDTDVMAMMNERIRELEDGIRRHRKDNYIKQAWMPTAPDESLWSLLPKARMEDA